MIINRSDAPNEIHNGENTHHQDQLITLNALKKTKIIVKIPGKLSPEPTYFTLSLIVYYFLCFIIHHKQPLYSCPNRNTYIFQSYQKLRIYTSKNLKFQTHP